MKKWLIVVLMCMVSAAHAYEIKGLGIVEKVSIDDILEGQSLSSEKDINEATKKLYATGWFKKISVRHVNGNVVFDVVENPLISGYKITTNLSSIKKEVLSDALESMGIKKFQVFDQYKLDSWVREMRAQLAMMGVNAQVKTTIARSQDNQSVFIDISITEMAALLLETIEITGAPVFSEDHILEVMDIQSTNWLSWIKKDNIYSDRKLEIAKEKLLLEYGRQGYFNAVIKSKTTSLSPERVAVSLSIEPGLPSKIKSVSTRSLPEEARTAFKALEGKRYDHAEIQKLIKTHSRVSEKDELKIYSEIKQMKDYQVDIQVVGFTKELPHIRQMVFKGQRTDEMALRKMVLLREGEVFNPTMAERSKQKLLNTSFIQQAQILPVPVKGQDQLVDVIVDVTENDKHTQASVSLNYSTGGHGFSFGAGVDNKNWLDTGNTMTLSTSIGKIEKSINLFLSQPANFYESSSMMGLGFVTKNTKELKSAKYKEDQGHITYGKTWVHGLNHEVSGALVLRARNFEILPDSPAYVQNFLNQHGNSLQELLLSGSWRYSSLDRYLHPTSGIKAGLRAQVAAPLIKDLLEYWTVQADFAHYVYLFDSFNQPIVFKSHAVMGFGHGFGSYQGDLPFFQRFFAGGMGTVRGYDHGSLGPKDGNSATGGNILLAGGFDILLPSPKPDIMTPSLFVDIGQVYIDKVSLKNMHVSAGLAVELWLPVGTLVLTQSRLFALDGSEKARNKFQLDIGQSF